MPRIKGVLWGVLGKFFFLIFCFYTYEYIHMYVPILYLHEHRASLWALCCALHFFSYYSLTVLYLRQICGIKANCCFSVFHEHY